MSIPGFADQEVVGFFPPPRRNRNAERRQRRRARQLQVGTAGCPTRVERDMQSSALPAARPVREIRVWQPKRATPQVESSEDQLTKRQNEASASRQTREARVQRRGALQPTLSHASLPGRTRQQHDIRVSSQQRRQTRVPQSRRGNRVPEVCVHSAQHMDASRLRSCEASLFDPSSMDLRDYLTKKRSAHQVTSSCCCQRLISMLAECRCGSSVHQQSLVRPVSYTHLTLPTKRIV